MPDIFSLVPVPTICFLAGKLLKGNTVLVDRMPHLHVQTRQAKYGSVCARGWFLFFHASSSINVFIPCQVEYSYKGPLQIPVSTVENTFKLEIQREESIIHHKTPPSYKLVCSRESKHTSTINLIFIRAKC